MISSNIANSLGFGSGIDTAALVNDLASASRAPKIQRIEALQSRNQAQISAVAQARSDLESFASSLSDVVSGGSLRSQPVVSNESALAATAKPGVRLGTLASEIEITQLARAQTIYSAVVASSSDPVGQGAMTLSVGGTDYSFGIDGSNDSMDGLTQAINATNSGVRASILSDSTGARLVLKGGSGSTNGFTLTADPGADPALTAFTYTGSGGPMTLGQTAQDAIFTLDGVAFTRASNTVEDVLPGVTLTLKKAAVGEPVAISAQRPIQSIRQTINDFVSVFNSVKNNIAAARTATGGDGALRNLDQQLSALISKSLTGDSQINSLSDIGLSTNRDGTISINATQLEAAISNNVDAVEALFNPLRDTNHTSDSDPGISFAMNEIKQAATASNGILDTLRTRLEKRAATIADDRARIESREEVYKARLEKQFGSMDARLGALRATQSYLQQQINIWSNSAR